MILNSLTVIDIVRRYVYGKELQYTNYTCASVCIYGKELQYTNCIPVHQRMSVVKNYSILTAYLCISVCLW